MDLEEIPGISEELNVEFSTINNSSQEPIEAETDEEWVPNNPALDFDTSHSDREEAALIDRFFYSGPCCKLGPKGTPCWKQFDCEKLKHARLQSLGLEKSELDVAVLATICAASSARSIIQYQLHSKRICKYTFLFIHGIGKKRLENLIIHYKKRRLMYQSTQKHR